MYVVYECCKSEIDFVHHVSVIDVVFAEAPCGTSILSDNTI